MPVSRHRRQRLAPADRSAPTAPHTPPADDSVLRAYWRNQYTREVYYDSAHDFDDHEPGYRKHAGRSFDETRDQLAEDYARIKGNSKLAWDKRRYTRRARHGTTSSGALPGDFDRDGR